MLSPSGASAGWSEPRALSPVGAYPWHSQTAAANTRGDAVVAWVREIDSFNRVLEGVRRRPGEEFGQPQLLTDRSLARAPRVAVAENGDLGVFWARETTVEGRVIARDGQSGPTFSLNAGRGTPQNLEIGFDAEGDATVFWSDGTRVWTATRAADGTVTTPAAVPNPGTQVHHAAHAVAANGDAVSVWKDYGGVYVSVRDGAGGVRSAALSAPARPSGFVDVAISARGDAFATWIECVSGCQDYVVKASYRPPGGRFGAPIPLPEATVLAPSVPVEIDGSGRATAIVSGWLDDDHQHGVFAATVRNGGSPAWERVSELAGCFADVAGDAAGNTYVAWYRYDGVCQGGDSRQYAAVRSASGSFSGRGEVISGGGDTSAPVVVGAGPEGAIAAWPRGSLAPTYEKRIEATTFTRSAVTAPTAPAPLALSTRLARGLKVTALRRRGVRVGIVCSEAARVRLRLSVGRAVARRLGMSRNVLATGRAACAPRSRVVALRVPTRLVQALARRRSTTLMLRVAAGARGNRASRARTIALTP